MHLLTLLPEIRYFHFEVNGDWKEMMVVSKGGKTAVAVASHGPETPVPAAWSTSCKAPQLLNHKYQRTV